MGSSSEEMRDESVPMDPGGAQRDEQASNRMSVKMDEQSAYLLKLAMALLEVGFGTDMIPDWAEEAEEHFQRICIQHLAIHMRQLGPFG